MRQPQWGRPRGAMREFYPSLAVCWCGLPDCQVRNGAACAAASTVAQTLAEDRAAPLACACPLTPTALPPLAACRLADFLKADFLEADFLEADFLEAAYCDHRYHQWRRQPEETNASKAAVGRCAAPDPAQVVMVSAETQLNPQPRPIQGL
jgi:hypothetical protein